MKRIKMVLYGEPGVGKSVFACKAPKPFFITTDGNYEWLEDFGADMNAYIRVNSWTEAKKAFQLDFSQYETIVVDLTEDLFKWCEQEYCVKNRIEHVSDVGYGKGYDTTRNEFFLEICKLIGQDKNVIFIMHGTDVVYKDRRGVEHTKHIPSPRIPDKLLDMIEGRVRYFLRCYLKAEEQEDNTLIKKRYLSLIPKENEFGIIRGIDETKVPQDIELDFNTFADVIGLFKGPQEPVVEKTIAKVKVENKKTEAKSDIVEGQVSIENINTQSNKESVTEPISETPEVINKASEVKEQAKQSLNEDKLAAIKAKMAALKK